MKWLFLRYEKYRTGQLFQAVYNVVEVNIFISF